MKYREIADGIFLDRPNRFIAHVDVNGTVETVHVKNTGRCKELLLPGAAVHLELPYSMSIIPDTVEGGFTVIFPELPGCMTCGDTIEEAVEMATDAKKCWLEDAIEMGKKIPLP